MALSHSLPEKKISEDDLSSLHSTIQKMKEKAITNLDWVLGDTTFFAILYNIQRDSFYILDKTLGKGASGTVYLAYPLKVTKGQVTIVKHPLVIKKSSMTNKEYIQEMVHKEVAGLSKLYSNISFFITKEHAYILSDYLPGQVIIPEKQELGSEILTLNKDIETLSFCQRLYVISEIARQLYRVNMPSLNEELPDNGVQRIHGDIKGSNFHLFVDESGLIQVSLLDFGTSEKITIEKNIYKPIITDKLIGSFGHITKDMILPSSTSASIKRKSPPSSPIRFSYKYEKTIGDDIHNCSPIIACLLGANNPYFDKAMAVYDVVLTEKYDLNVVNDIKDFKPAEQKKSSIVLSKDESGSYSAYYYIHSLESFIEEPIKNELKDSEQKWIVHYKLNDSEAEKKLASPLSVTDKTFFIKKALQLKGDFDYNTLKSNASHYIAEQKIPYNLTGLYNHDLYKNWLITQTYTEKFLQRMQGIDKKSEQVNPLEFRLFWGALHYFCDKNEKTLSEKPLDFNEWQTTFDFLLTDELQKNHSEEIKQFRELVQLFFGKMDENNLQHKMKKEMSLFWEAINGFITTYKNAPDEALSYLTKLAILSTLGLSRLVWENDFKKYNVVNDKNFNETVIALSKSTDSYSKLALTLLFTSTYPVRDAIVKLYKENLFAGKQEPLIKKLSECADQSKSPSAAAIKLAQNILSGSTLELKTISFARFRELYNEIKQSSEYNPSFFKQLSFDSSTFKKSDKLELEELKKQISEARDDFERYQCVHQFVAKNPDSPITKKIVPLIEQSTEIQSSLGSARSCP